MQDKKQLALQTFSGKSFRKSKSEISQLFPEFKIKVFDEHGKYLEKISTVTDEKNQKYIIIHLGPFYKIITIRFSSIIN